MRIGKFGFITVILASAVLPAMSLAQSAQVHWVCSTDAQPWTEQPPLDAVEQDTQSFGAFIPVDSTQKFQEIDGWGGCFNERGWKAMEVLSEPQRQEILHNLFDPKDGLKLNLCRTPIGASDYGIDLYSLDETPGDYQMEHFSIDRDKQRLIPYIKAAMAIQPKLKVWGVPWSPPSWMKDNNRLIGGHIKEDNQTLDALALYFVKYVQAYRAEGIPLYMVMPQNEPSVWSNYTSCIWTGAQLAKFIGGHLGPAFKRENLDCQIYLGTITTSAGSWDYVGAARPSLDDPATRAFISGVGCQWAGNELMSDIHFLHPQIKLMQTENECGKTNTNDWAFAQHQFDRARTYFNAGASASMIWNLVLDETGSSTAGWAQCSPIVVDQKSATVRYTPYFYLYKHFSYFIQPGAHRIAIGGGWGDKIAFANPDGQVIVILGNSADKDAGVSLDVDGRTIKPTLPAHSFETFVVPPRTK